MDTKVDVAPAVAPPAKTMGKGKREAEEVTEKQVTEKKQKTNGAVERAVEKKEVEVKTHKKILKKEESRSSGEDSSSESAEDKKGTNVEMVDAPSAKKTPQTPATPQAVGSKTLFVGNLPYSIEENDVRDFFKDAGEIARVRLGMRDDKFRCFAHVEFTTEAAAQKALELNNKLILNSRPVRLGMAPERGSYTPASGKENSYQRGGRAQGQTVYVRGFDNNDSEENIRSKLEELFGTCGVISRMFIPKDFESGSVKGFAYIDFSDAGAFIKALDLSGSEFGEGYVIVEPKADREGSWRGKENSYHRGGGAQRNAVYVRGFDNNDSEENIRGKLQELFGTCGKISRMFIPKDCDSGSVKGFAYIKFSDAGAFIKALELSGSEFGEGYVIVEPRADSNDGFDNKDSEENPTQDSKKTSDSDEDSSKEDEEDSSEEEDGQPSKTPKKNGTNVEMIDAPSAKKTPQTPATPQAGGSKTLFVGNLPFSIEEKDVRDFFKDAGEIAEVRFAMRDDKFRGYAHVEFTTAAAAHKALELNDKLIVNSRPVKLEMAHERGSYTPASRKENSYQRGSRGHGFDNKDSEENPTQDSKKTNDSDEDSSKEDEEDSSEEEDGPPSKTPKKNGTDVEMVDAPSAKKTPQTPATPQAGGSKTLFVGNLPFSIEEKDVRDFFKDAGEIAEVRFAMRDDKFRGYAHVEFTTAAAAHKALELNDKLIVNSRPVKLEMAHERGSYTPACRKENSYQRGSRGHGFNNKDSEENPTQDSKKTNDSDEDSSKEDEEDSSEEEDGQPSKTPKKNGTEVEMVDAPSAKKTPQTPATPQAGGSKTLFVGNLPFSIEEKDVRDFFKDAGEIAEVRFAMRDDKFRGYAHVEFTTAAAAHKALELNDKLIVNSRPVKLEMAHERGSYTPASGKENSYQRGGRGHGQTVYVRGFNNNDSEENIRSKLKELFGTCGEISRISIPIYYDSGSVKGFAYIDFLDVDAFNKALELSGSEFGEGGSVEVVKPRADGREGSVRGRCRGFSGDAGRGRGGRFGGRDGGRFGGRDGGGRFGGGRGQRTKN